MNSDDIHEPSYPHLPKIDPNAPDRLESTVTVHERLIGLILDCFDPVELAEKKLNPLKIGTEFAKHWFRSREEKALIEAHRNLRHVVSHMREIDSEVFKYAFQCMKPVHTRALQALCEFSSGEPTTSSFFDYLQSRNFDFEGQPALEVMSKLDELGLVEITELHERLGGGWSRSPDPRWSMQTGNIRVSPWTLWKPVLTVSGRQVAAIIDKGYDLALGLPVNFGF